MRKTIAKAELESMHAAFARNPGMDCVRSVLDHSTFLADDPFAGARVEKKRTLAFPRTGAGMDLDVAGSWRSDSAVAACTVVLDSVELDPGGPIARRGILDLLAGGRSFQLDAT